MDNQTKGTSVILTIVAWGAIWGIFEAVVGYVLHMIPFQFAWLIWYPVACFFMANVYRKTRKPSAVLMMGILCSCIKLLNLFLPGRVDKVINPAISIVFEAMAMAAVISLMHHFCHKEQKHPMIKAAAVLGMNTGWRLMYVLYLLFFVPAWMRDVSVISSLDLFIPFFVTQNLITTMLLFLGYQLQHAIFRPIEAVERKMASIRGNIPSHLIPVLKTSTVVIMFFLCIALNFVL